MTQPIDSPRSVSIYTKIFLTMLSVSLIPLLAVGIRVVQNEEAQTTPRVNREFEQEAKVLAANVSGWIETNVKALQQNALLADIRSMDPARQTPVLQAMVNTYGWTFLASTIGSDGKNVARSDITPSIDYSDREYFRQAMAGKGLGQQVVISKTIGKPALVLATAYPALGGGTGVLMTSSALSDVTDTIAASHIGRTGFSFLLDNKGRVISHPSPEFSGKLGDLSNHPAFTATRSAPTARVTFTEGGKEFVAHAMVIPLGWVIVVQQETDEAFTPIRNAMRNAVIVVLSVAAVALIASYLLARGLALPILRLTNVADAVSRGETNVEIAEVDRGDELGGLARAIDRMRISIDVAMKRLRRGTGGQA
jgi:methyl-accepting chemotaxis protein